MFDGSSKSVLLELMQNARRAGATKIDISFIDETLNIAHDGMPFDNFQKLFSLGSSGWEKQGIKNEDPAGMGFFVSTLFESVEVISRKDENSAYIIKAAKTQLTKENSKLDINIVEFKNSIHNVELRLHDGVAVNEYDYRQVAEHFPVPSTFTGMINGKIQTISEEYKLDQADKKKNNPRLLEKTVNGVRMFFQKINTYSCGHSHPVYFNYHGHKVDLSGQINLLMRQVIRENGLVLVVLPEENSKLRLTLPARESIVKDKTYFQMLEDIKDILAEYINHQDNHNLPYETYLELGGSGKIKQEAAIPEGLKKYWYSCGQNLNILFHNVDNVLNCNLFPYKGYSWYDNYTELSEDNIALRIVADGKVSTIPLKAFPCEKAETQSGLVDNMELIYVQSGQEPELISSLKQAVLLGSYNEGLYGYFEQYDDEVWICKGEDINSSLDYLEDCLVSFWEPNDNGDCDSWETQLEEFRDALRHWWEDVFLPEDKELLSIQRALSKTCWQFGNAAMIVIKEDTVYFSDNTGSVIKLSKEDENNIREIIKRQ
jgi:hypothetical protein